MAYCDYSAGNSRQLYLFIFFPVLNSVPILSLQVINVLTSSKELFDLIKMVDSVFHSKQAGCGKSMLNSLCRFVPSIREQMQVIFHLYHLSEICLF